LQRFEEMTSNWNRDIFYLTKKAGKDPQSSVMSRSGWFREKKELGEMIEAAKTDPEKIGDRYWMVSLRKDLDKFKMINNKNLSGFGHGSKLLGNNNALRAINTERSFQVIRKPNNYLNETYEATSASRGMNSKMIDRTSKEYLDNKIGMFGKIIKKINPCNGQDVGELIIEGKNQLDLEINDIVKDTKSSYMFPKGSDFFHKENEKVEEVIMQDFSRSIVPKSALSTM